MADNFSSFKKDLPDYVRTESDFELFKMRHSAEHVLTQAMLNLYGTEKIKMAMGPATAEGFYFDFETRDITINEEDFPKIEAEMQKLVSQAIPIVRSEISYKEAEKLFSSNTYKVEWLEGIKENKESLSIYRTGKGFTDLCRGPHVANTSQIGVFKLLKIAGAYWHGDEHNKMLVRIYGTSFHSQAELDAYLLQQEEALKRDHRKLGKDLDLFVFTDLVGKGLPLLTPRGTVIRRQLEKLVLEEEEKWGYQHVITPPLAKTELYKKSGHYPYYKDTMYPLMKVDDEELILRPMTCPHHFMLYGSRKHSYKEMPVRYAELSPQFRYEKSGELSGLTRVRMFCLADAHIICMKEQAKEEIKRVLNLIDHINKIFGFGKGVDYRYRLSLGDRSDTKKYYQDDQAWDFAEGVLRDVLDDLKAPYFEAAGEAAFYGPKIDIQMKKINGQEETAFTVQYDFVMPGRFEMTYINQKGAEEQPIVIHRSSIGAFERTMAFLIEYYGGAFPAWLSPEQVRIIPISDQNKDYAMKIAEALNAVGIRNSIDIEDDRMQNKIRQAQELKIPYMVIIGKKEEEKGVVSLRYRNGTEIRDVNFETLVNKLNQNISTRALDITLEL